MLSFTQRKDINKGISIQKPSQEWPFLFKEVGMAAHFQELTGVSLMESFLVNVDNMRGRLLSFLKSVDARKHKQVLDALIKFQTQRGQLDGFSDDAIQMVLLLLAHFGEKEENLFHCVEETCLAQEIQMERLPATPCILCG